MAAPTNNGSMKDKPNNPRDVLVWLDNCGWIMGNYENGVWRLYYSDTGLQICKNPEDVLHWHELPDKPFQL